MLIRESGFGEMWQVKIEKLERAGSLGTLTKKYSNQSAAEEMFFFSQVFIFYHLRFRQLLLDDLSGQ